MKYTFEQLEKMSDKDIKIAKEAAQNKLSDLRNQKWQDIASILYYQSEIEKYGETP